MSAPYEPAHLIISVPCMNQLHLIMSAPYEPADLPHHICPLYEAAHLIIFTRPPAVDAGGQVIVVVAGCRKAAVRLVQSPGCSHIAVCDVVLTSGVFWQQ